MKPHLWLIKFIGLIVPRRLRADWRQEWETELRYREKHLAEWDNLDRRGKLALLWHSLGAFMDALWLQPRRMEDEMFQDLRFGARMIAKTPGFTIVVAFTLALGIGANTAIFGLVDAALFRPLPVVEAPDQLVVIARGADAQGTLSYLNFKDLRDRNEVLSGLAVSRVTPISFGNGVRSEVALGSLVSANYFDALGIKPVLGRTFLPEEDNTPGAHPVVVLSHGFWRSRFNGDPALVGRSIVLNNQQFTVVGVAPAGFDGEALPMKVNMWVPAMMTTAMMPPPPFEQRVPPDLLSDRQYELFSAIGRLKRGVDLAQAQAALETINRQLEQSNPVPPERRFYPNADRSLRLVRPRGIALGPIREMAATGSALLAATVLAVLLIACANVANLLLARATTRRKEIAVRLALGATRLRLIRQLLTESVLLALIGATAGLLFAYWIKRLLLAFKPPFPSAFTVTLDLPLDGRALGFTLLLAVATGVIFGCYLPARKATKVDLLVALRHE